MLERTLTPSPRSNRRSCNSRATSSTDSWLPRILQDQVSASVHLVEGSGYQDAPFGDRGADLANEAFHVKVLENATDDGAR